MGCKAVFVAATRQHVGKTSTCLGMVSGLTKRFGRVGFIKPVGQEHVKAENVRVDKDVKLVREYFGLTQCRLEQMSPVVIPAGYTRKYLDKVDGFSDADQLFKINSSFAAIRDSSDFVVVEGTGHVGVGAICNVSNAQVAAMLGVPMVLVVNGGLGKAFDELALNKAMCDAHGVRIKGVIINKIQPDKVEMIREYMGKALQRWNLGLLACIPDAHFLGEPTMLDFEQLFKTKLLAGSQWRSTHHFKNVELVTTGLSKFLEKCQAGDGLEVQENTLIVCHASRNDIILGYITHAHRMTREKGSAWKGGLILTGTPRQGGVPVDNSSHMRYAEMSGSSSREPSSVLSSAIKQQINDANQVPSFMLPFINESPIPVLYAPFKTYDVMRMMERYTAKLNVEDATRTKAVVSHYESHIDFQRLLE